MMRATSDAVLVGSGTVIADDPQLNCRLPGMADRSPIRVVLDGNIAHSGPIASSCRRRAKFRSGSIATERAPAEAEKRLDARPGSRFSACRRRRTDRLDLEVALRRLAERGITRVLVEGGPML